MSYKTKFAFFFLIFLAIALIPNVKPISISENVQFSFGCSGNQPFPKNCSGNYYFQVSNLTFFNIQLHPTYSMWDYRKICRTPPFFQYVYQYSHIFDWECCDSNWVANYTSCTIGDNHTLEYYDSNFCLFPNNIPIDNGTISYCNYCSEDLYPMYGECWDNSTQSIDWSDLNFFTCCDVTGLSSDCSIYTYPYNETTYQSCNSTSANIGIPNCRELPEISNQVREDCVVTIPEQYMGENYKCFSIVKDKETGQILQVNPDRNRTYPVYEEREYFTPLYNNVNFYYTAENLNPEKEYVVRLECSSENRIIYSEYTIERKYENLSWIYYRILWLTENAPYVIAGVIVIILILTSIFFLMKFF